MELEIITKTLFALGFVLSILFIMLKLLQKYTRFGLRSKLAGKDGLKIENIVYIDEATKIINISNSTGFNYIVAIGKQNSFLIDKYRITKKE